MGGFGAIAGFSHKGDDTEVAQTDTRIELRTTAAAMRIDYAAILPVAFETISSTPDSWNHGIALCVQEQRLADGPTGIGVPQFDPDMLLDTEAGAVTFDLGISSSQVRVKLRTAETGIVSLMEHSQGCDFTALSAAETTLLAAVQLDWIFETPIGRLEVRQEPESHPTGLSYPPFIMPNLLKSGLTHARTTALPEGLVPCGYAFPAHPARSRPGRPKPFDLAEHQRFQALFDRYGRTDLVHLKRRTEALLERGGFDMLGANNREAQATVRVGLRQRLMMEPQTDLTLWLEAYDLPLRDHIRQLRQSGTR